MHGWVNASRVRVRVPASKRPASDSWLGPAPFDFTSHGPRRQHTWTRSTSQHVEFPISFCLCSGIGLGCFIRKLFVYALDRIYPPKLPNIKVSSALLLAVVPWYTVYFLPCEGNQMQSRRTSHGVSPLAVSEAQVVSELFPGKTNPQPGPRT